MRKDLLPKHLQNIVIRGFDETAEEKAAREAAEAKAKEDEEEEDDEDEEGEDKNKTEDNANLLSALKKERADRKKLEKENRRLAAAQKAVEDKDKSETDKAKDDALVADTKAKRLAAKLLETSVDNEITKAATKLKFRDLDDALKLVNRKEISVEQDEDEPDDIEVDKATVEAALKKLAKDKPHLILADGQEDKSGSPFNKKRKSDKDADEDAMIDNYPALQNRRQQTATSS